MKLYSVNVGDTFSVAGIEFIKFSQDGDRVVAVTKDSLFYSRFGDNNNFAESTVLKRLKEEILPKLEAEVGEENIFEFETNLLSLDGSDIYGKVKSKISIPTFDFYRQNVKMFDKHKLGNWWWLATPDSTEEHLNDDWIICVAPSGYVNRGGGSYYYDGVRPFCIFNSSISVSSET